ncbi:MAG: 16S rRNA (guanine(527)-N(7))-methyltransferase RsmG [Magnetococcales bacterium]|nr:16S rRNA (guanine(527)-N(7))-methyltransferase RsmG [Magnetococcales bacterium]
MPNPEEWSRCFTRLQRLTGQLIDSQQQLRLQRYVELLLKWNRTYNLIGPSTVSSILDRHIIDCAPLLPLLPAGSRIADIGSGAGLPGLVLAILSPPPSQISLIESVGKKTRFLSHVTHQLELDKNCVVYTQRAEQHAKQKINKYHFVVSRAVGTVSLLAKLSVDLLQPGGYCLALKGERSEHEVFEFLSTPQHLFFEKPEIIPIDDIPGATVVRIKKVPRET